MAAFSRRAFANSVPSRAWRSPPQKAHMSEKPAELPTMRPNHECEGPRILVRRTGWRTESHTAGSPVRTVASPETQPGGRRAEWRGDREGGQGEGTGREDRNATRDYPVSFRRTKGLNGTVHKPHLTDTENATPNSDSSLQAKFHQMCTWNIY